MSEEEKYQPTQEEVKKAEEAISDDEKKITEKREEALNFVDIVRSQAKVSKTKEDHDYYKAALEITEKVMELVKAGKEGFIEVKDSPRTPLGKFFWDGLCSNQEYVKLDEIARDLTEGKMRVEIQGNRVVVIKEKEEK